MHARLDEAGRDERGRPAHRARRVHPEQRFADGAERIREVQLGHHHALEQVRRLADHHGVDVGQAQAGVGDGPVHRLAAEPGDGHVGPPCPVPGLAHSDDRGLMLHDVSGVGRACRAGLHRPVHRASITHTRFCWSAGPLVAWPRARPARPVMICPGRLPDARQAGREHRIAAQRAARGIDRDALAEPQGFP